MGSCPASSPAAHPESSLQSAANRIAFLKFAALSGFAAAIALLPSSVSPKSLLSGESLLTQFGIGLAVSANTLAYAVLRVVPASLAFAPGARGWRGRGLWLFAMVTGIVVVLISDARASTGSAAIGAAFVVVFAMFGARAFPPVLLLVAWCSSQRCQRLPHQRSSMTPTVQTRMANSREHAAIRRGVLRRQCSVGRGRGLREYPEHLIHDWRQACHIDFAGPVHRSQCPILRSSTWRESVPLGSKQ